MCAAETSTSIQKVGEKSYAETQKSRFNTYS